MKRFVLAGALLVTVMPRFLGAGQAKSPARDETLNFEDFGTLHIYRESPHPPNGVLFISGDGGWNAGVANMAPALASLDFLVVGVDITRFLKSLVDDGEKCSYYAWLTDDSTGASVIDCW